MAEIKNNFIKSKMNKDLDARLVPVGEYRNAVNAQISRSEGEGVGTLENILGNEVVATIEASLPNLVCIGNFIAVFQLKKSFNKPYISSLFADLDILPNVA